MTPKLLVLSLTLAAAAVPAAAEDKPATDQVIVPQVERRDIRLPRYPSNDISLGAFAGTYATQNFGSSAVKGVRLGYHVTEDIFFEATHGSSTVSDDAFRQILPGGVFVDRSQSLRYTNVSVGYNVLPGEVFFGRGVAKATQGYVVAGIGSTTFADQKRQTINVGFGLRVVFTDWLALQADVRDHLFSLDLLGKRQSTQNPEITAGLTFFF